MNGETDLSHVTAFGPIDYVLHREICAARPEHGPTRVALAMMMSDSVSEALGFLDLPPDDVGESMAAAWKRIRETPHRKTEEWQAAREREACCVRCRDEAEAEDTSGLQMIRTMMTCSTCGNKRCPKASDHRHECTHSNAPGQRGSVYPSGSSMLRASNGEHSTDGDYDPFFRGTREEQIAAMERGEI
jgi:hypothetical protein